MGDDDDETPMVIVHQDVQKRIDADPELAKAMQKFKEDALNAMQAVKDGRHPDFDAAMRALGYEAESITDEEYEDEVEALMKDRDDDEER